MTYEELCLWLKAFVHEDDVPKECTVNIETEIAELSFNSDILDIDVTGKKLTAWINGISINIPVLKIHLKTIYTPYLYNQ